MNSRKRYSKAEAFKNYEFQKEILKSWSFWELWITERDTQKLKLTRRVRSEECDITASLSEMVTSSSCRVGTGFWWVGNSCQPQPHHQLKIQSGQIGSAWERCHWIQWIGPLKKSSTAIGFWFFNFSYDFFFKLQSSVPLHSKTNHGLYGHKPQSFQPHTVLQKCRKNNTIVLWIKARVWNIPASRNQGCGSGSGLDPDSIGSVDPDPDPGGQKWPTEVDKKILKFIFWSVGWPLLRAEGFFCNLDVLYGGLGIGKLQFLIKKNFFQLYFFPIFGH